MAKSSKVYDFNLSRVKSKIVATLKRHNRESTVADLVAATALPKFQVEQAIKHVASEYQGHLRVTESGEILYYFPRGMRSTERGFVPRAKRLLGGFLRVTGKTLAFLFKVWIMVMLVGYFLLFLAILVLAIVTAIAAQFAGRRDSRRSSSGGGIMGFYLVSRVIQMFLWIWLFSGQGSYKQPRKQGKPLYKSVFAYVFGEPSEESLWQDRQKQYILSFIRGRKGVLTLLELVVLTGKGSEEAQQTMHRLLIELEGEPSVTEAGSLIYLFPELLRTKPENLQAAAGLPLLNPESPPLIPFNGNTKKANFWITFLNGFNILFSSYFLYFALTNPAPLFDVVKGAQKLRVDFSFLYQFLNDWLGRLGAEPSVLLILIGLGVIPLAFSLFFYLIPFIRGRIDAKKNERIKEENLRKKVYFHVLGSADQVYPQEIRPVGEAETPAGVEGFKVRVLDELAAATSGEIEKTDNRGFLYRFPEIDRELRDVREYRKSVDLSRFDVGGTVFDSGD